MYEDPEEQEEFVLPPRQKFKDPSWMTWNAEQRIHLIAHWEVKVSTEPDTSSGVYEFFCSYSWKQAPSATICVPGMLAKWTPPQLPKQLDQTKGFIGAINMVTVCTDISFNLSSRHSP
jgi:hypothetical protein